MNLAFGMSILLTLIILELVVLAKVEKRQLPWKEIVTNVNSGHIIIWVARMVILILYKYFAANWSFGLISDLPLYIQFTVALIAWDFCFYWSHRTHHTLKFLWSVHSVHHQGEHFSLSLGIRNSWYQSLTSFPFFIILALIGVSFEQFLLVSSIHYFIQFFNHNAIIGKTGILELFFMTPSHHRVHHGKNEEYLNKNHGGTFVFWDKMFGTFQGERDDIVIQYGTTDNINPENPFWANMLPVLSYFKVKQRQDRAINTLVNPLKDGYLIVGALFLFLLFLTYIKYENTWSFEQLLILIIIVFAGTIALGSIAKNERIGLISWIIISTPLLVAYTMYFQVYDYTLLGIVGAMTLHGIYGTYKLFNQPIEQKRTV